MAEPSNPRRRWFRFSLRGLLIGVALASALLAWRLKTVRELDKAILALNKASFLTTVHSTINPLEINKRRPYWKRVLAGEGDQFWTVQSIGEPDISSKMDCATFLKLIDDLRRLDNLICFMVEESHVTSLSESESDQILQEIGTLRSLENLGIGNLKIDDGNIRHLELMNKLKVIHFPHGNETDAGLDRLQRALPGCWLWIEDSPRVRRPPEQWSP